MKIVFFGSPEQAVAALRTLLERGHSVAAVYTQPDRPAGRSRSPAPTPVRQAAEAAGVPVRTPRSLRDATVQVELAAFRADVFVVAAYGKLLPPEALRIPRLGVLNVHPSLLPKYRGPSPVQQTILDGAEQTGVTVMLLDEGMDTGPILAQSAPVRLTGAETAGALMARLFELGAGLLADTIEKWARGEITPRPQDNAQATVTKLLSREDGEIDWSQPAQRIARMVRAYDPWPGTHTRWRGRALKVLVAQAVPPPSPSTGEEPALTTMPIGAKGPGGGETRVAGTVSVRDGGVVVATGEGALRLHRLQLEGKKAVSAEEFVRGYPAFPGSALPS